MLIVCMLAAVSVAAQNPNQGNNRQPRQGWQPNRNQQQGPVRNEQFSPAEYFQQQREFFIRNAQLTEQEAEAFFPVYNELQQKKRELNREIRRIMREEGGSEMSQEQCLKAIDAKAEANIKIAALEKEYLQKFKEILPASKILKVQNAEEQFNSQILKDIQQTRGHQFQQQPAQPQRPQRPMRPQFNQQEQNKQEDVTNQLPKRSELSAHSFFSETGRDINHLPVLNPIHPLVGVGTGQRPLAFNVRPHLYIVQGLHPEAVRKFLTARIPGGLESGCMHMVGQLHNLVRLAVTSHKAYTGDITSVTLQQSVQQLLIKRIAYILLQLRAVATRATIRTLGEVKR